MLVGVVRVVADEVGERDQVGQVAVAPVPQPVGGVHRAVERRVAGQRPLDPVQRLVEPAVVGQGAGDVRVHRQVVGVVLDGPAAARRGPRRVRPALRYAYPSHTSPSLDGCARTPRLAQSTASVTSPSRRASADAAPSSRPCSGCAVTACRASVRYGAERPRPARGTGSATAAQTCIRTRAIRSGSSRSASSGAVTQGDAGPVGRRGVRGRGGQQLQPVGGPAGGGEQVGAGHHGADEGVLVEREEVEPAVVGPAASRASVSCTSGRVGAYASAPARWSAACVQVALVEGQPGQRQLSVGGQRGGRPFPRARRPLVRVRAGWGPAW